MGEKLNLKDLVGRRQVVVPRYVKQIEQKLSEASDENEIRILTAYLTAFKYYEEISNMEGDYVKKTMEYLNREALYLKERFPYVYIEPQGRIKSPISADTKIREKIKEYIDKGRDLANITNSLRDFIGFRYVIDLPNIIESDPKKSTEICYEILQAQMEFQKANGFEFIEVGEAKQKKLKSNKSYKSDPAKKGVFIPKERPAGIEQFDPYLKDYIMYPTSTLYQSAQYCVIPSWAKDMKNGHPAAIEFQVRTERMHDFAEHDELAAHNSYKKRTQTFHRLSVPFEFTFMPDEKGDLTGNIGQVPYDYSIEKFYGTSFYDRFGIDYKEFIDLFDQETQDQIYAGNYHVELRNGEYQVVKTPLKEKTITQVKRAFEGFKFTFAHPIKSIKNLLSFSEDDDRDLVI